MDSDNDYDVGDEIEQPYNKENWYDDLQEASGLDTYPELSLLSPPSPATEDCASYTVVMHRAAHHFRDLN